MDLERLKEQIAYLKFWQGIVVVTDISVLHRIALALFTVVLLSLGGISLHRRIERRIHEIGQLSPWKSL